MRHLALLWAQPRSDSLLAVWQRSMEQRSMEQRSMEQRSEVSVAHAVREVIGMDTINYICTPTADTAGEPPTAR